MSVYVDNMRAHYGRMRMSHMLADSTDELLAMADAIGVQQKWLQKAGTEHEHFDVCDNMRAAAIRLGATPVTMRGMVEVIQRRREALAAQSQEHSLNELRDRLERVANERGPGALGDLVPTSANLKLSGNEARNLLALLSEAQPRERDAERWRALIGCPRVRFIGGARLGEPDALLGVEFYADYPPEMRDDNSHAVGLLTTFADNLLAAPASPPVSGEREAVGCDGEFRFAKRLDDGDLYRCVKCGAERLLPHG